MEYGAAYREAFPSFPIQAFPCAILPVWLPALSGRADPDQASLVGKARSTGNVRRGQAE